MERLFRAKCDKLTDAGWEIMAGNYVLGVVHLSPDDIQDMDEETLKFKGKLSCLFKLN